MWVTEITLCKQKQVIIVRHNPFQTVLSSVKMICFQAQQTHYNYGSKKLKLRIVSMNQGKFLTIATTHDVEQSASKTD